MIKFIPAKKPYKPKIGDLLCDHFDKDASTYLTRQDPKSQKIIPLGVLYPNPWVALTDLGIDYKQITVRYTCPYTEYEHFAIVPTALIINGEVEVYSKVRHYNPKFVLDWEWHQKMIPDRLTLGRIARTLLGSGYTNSWNANDGHGAIVECRATLDNGDMLHCHTWEWYNK